MFFEKRVDRVTWDLEFKKSPSAAVDVVSCSPSASLKEASVWF
jgi:hypothetical protein